MFARSYYYFVNRIMQLSHYCLKPALFIEKCICKMVLPLSVDTHIFLIHPLLSEAAALGRCNGSPVRRHNIRLNPVKVPNLKHIQTPRLKSFPHNPLTNFLFIKMISDQT